jgi:hypothetical protein
LVAVLVAVLVSGPVAVSGTPSAVAARGLGTGALDQLAKLEDLRLEGVLDTADGAPLTFDIAATDDGTTATVTDAGGGVAQFVSAEDKVVVKANGAWWLNTIPAYQLPLTGKWVRATEDMGFPIGMLETLSPRSLHEMVARTADGMWSATSTVYPDGTPAYAVTAKDSPWTVYVATQGDGRLLGLDGPLADVGQRLRQGGGQSYPSASFSTSAADDPCDKATKRKIEEAKPQVEAAPEAPPIPEAGHGPEVSISSPSTGVCTTPMCPTPVVVTNSGDEAAVGMLSVSSSSGGGGTFPVNVAPNGGTQQHMVSVVNPASSCTQTCTRQYQINAFVQYSSAGTDLGQGQRLRDKGVDPNAPVPGKPSISGPGVNGTIDNLTTPGVAPAGVVRQQDDLVDEVTEIAKKAPDADITSLLEIIGRYRDTIGTAAGERHPAITLGRETIRGNGRAKLVARQALSLLAELAVRKGRARGSIAVDKGLIRDIQNKRVYSLAGVGGDKQQGDPDERTYDAAKEAVERAKSAPSGYSKVVLIDFADRVPKFGNVPRADLIAELLQGVEVNGNTMRELFLDGSGKPVIDLLAVSNAKTRQIGHRYTFTASELEAMGYTQTANPPTSPPDVKDVVVTPENKTHILDGDPYDPGDEQRNQDQSGGHRSGAGVPGKSEFPASWTWEDIDDAIRQVVAQGNPARAPQDGINPMGGTQWNWVLDGAATINGVTVLLEVIVYDNGSVRTAYPADGNQVGKPNDPNAVFVNPKLPDDFDAKLGDVERTGPVRYDRNTGTFTAPGIDADGNPVTVTTDEEGNPALDIGDPQAPPPLSAPVVPC